MALSRLAHAGDIRRIGRGLYDYPRQHAKLGALSPDSGQVTQAFSAQSGDTLAPSEAAATVRTDLREELGFLAIFDRAMAGLRAIVDMPDRRAALLIRLLLQNSGKLPTASAASSTN